MNWSGDDIGVVGEMKGVLSISFLFCCLLLLLDSSVSLPLCVDSSEFLSLSLSLSPCFSLCCDVLCIVFCLWCRGTLYLEQDTWVLSLQWKHVLQLHTRCTDWEAIPSKQRFRSWLCLGFEINTLCGKVSVFILPKSMDLDQDHEKCLFSLPL